MLLRSIKCEFETSLPARTLFQDAGKPLRLWFQAMWNVTNHKQGANSLELQFLLGFGSYRTAWTWLRKLRRAMGRPGQDRLSGLVEVDETFVGGLEPGKWGLIAADGRLIPLVNFGFIFGASITQLAVRHGTEPAAAPNAVWALAFTSNYVVNVAYCLYLMWRNQAFRAFSAATTGKYWVWTLFMGFVWAGKSLSTVWGHLRRDIRSILGFPDHAHLVGAGWQPRWCTNW